MQFVPPVSADLYPGGRVAACSPPRAQKENGRAVSEGAWAPLPCHRSVCRWNPIGAFAVFERSCLCRWQLYSLWTVWTGSYSNK